VKKCFAAVLVALSADAATIRIAPDAGSFVEIEAAQPGDEVVIAPGTYRFRVELRQRGAAPLVVRAEDPLRPPVFDYTGADLLTFPGSSSVEYRSAWHVQSAWVELSNLVIRGAHDPSNQASCLRFNDSSGRAIGIDARGCDHGLEAGGNDVVLEHCIAVDNRVSAIAGYGGKLTLRYSWVSNSPSLFYVNGSETTFEYNWFSRAGGFMGIYSGCGYGCGSTGQEPVTVYRAFRGNVVVLSPSQTNMSLNLVVNGDAPSSDGTGRTAKLVVDVHHNTFIGVAGASDNPVAVVNYDGIEIELDVTNNVMAEFAQAQATQQGPVALTGRNNWVTSGTTVPAELTGTVSGAVPKLDADYRPLDGSPLLGAAAALGAKAPVREYYLNETEAARYRVRAAAGDIGAFERTTTGPGISAQDLRPSPDGGTAAAPRALSAGCGCSSVGPGLLLFALLGLARLRAPSRGA